jgi:hypothetical protein
MGFTCLRDIGRVMKFDFDPDPMPDAPVALTFDEFTEAVSRLEKADVTSSEAARRPGPTFADGG